MKNQVISIYRQAERFADITQRAIMSGNIPRAKKCLAYAETLLLNGSKETQSAISGIYVHAISSFMELRHCNIAGLFPNGLKAVYVQQINASGV